MKGGGVYRYIAETFNISALNSIKDTKRILRRSTSGIYEDVAAGRLEAVKVGSATRITGQSIIGFIQRAPPGNCSPPVWNG
jgi:hypothetical protein